MKIFPDAIGLGQWYGPGNGGAMGLWLRFFDPHGRLVPLLEEAERQRAEAAEAEITRLRALLDEEE